MYDQFKAKNTEILGCSFDDEAANRKFAEKNRFPFRLLPDPDKRLGVLYGACSSTADEYPHRIAYLIDEEGVIREVHPNVTPAKYPAEQLARL